MALEIEIRDYSKKDFKVKRFTWTPGQHTIRILDTKIPMKMCYWFSNGYVESLGWDDPQSTFNKRIRLENPDNYKNIKGYRPPSDRYAVNVLDRTLTKICPNCNADVKAVNGTFPGLCLACGVGVVSDLEAKPLNEVRVLQGGKTLFEQFKVRDQDTLDEEGNPRGIQNFDLILHVVGVGNQRQVVAVASTNYDKVEVPPEKLYNTETLTIKVSEEEMEQLVRGVVLRDIFAARRATTEVEVADEVRTDTEEIKRKVEELFA